MADLKNSTEIVTDKDLDSVLKSTTFDSATFLRLYSEWKATKDTHTFAVLRKMHEDAGYNNKNNIFGAEQEMNQIAAIVQKYQDGKNQVTTSTATATASVGHTVQGGMTAPVEVKTNIPDVNPERIQFLKTLLENEAKSPLTPDGLSKIFDKLKDEKDIDSRAVITSFIWSKLTNNGYVVSVKNNTVSIEHKTDTMGAVSLQKTLQAYIGANILALADIQRAMIVGPNSFGQYIDTQKININNTSTTGYAQFIMEARGLDISRATTLEDKVRIIQSSKATPEEKAMLISYVNGGLNSYNITPEVSRQLKISAIGAELKASPAFQKTEKAVAAISGGGAKAEKKRMEEEKDDLTWNSFLDNPMRAITKYPWTSLGLVIGSIYQFGFMKTLLGLMGGFIGYKVIDEFGGIDAMKKKEAKPAPANGTAGAPASAPTVQKMDHTIDLSKKGPHEQKLWTNLQKTKSITNVLDNRSEKLGTYMMYIDQNNLLDKTLGDLVYINPSDQSIFSNKPGLPTGFPALPAGVDAVMLKRILRVLISGIDKYPATDLDGANHTKNYKEWVLGKVESDKIKDDDWKKKKIIDIVSHIAVKL